MAEGYVINHKHKDGRQCIIGPDGLWRHWEMEPDGPQDPGEWLCIRPHPDSPARLVNIDGPEPVSVDDDRGEFGMPIIGGLYRAYMDSDIGMTDDEDIDGGDDDVDTGDDDDTVLDIRTGSVIWHQPNGDKYRVDVASDDADYILNDILPIVVTGFLKKNQKYAEVENGYDLGEAGIIPDLNRKLGILVARIWHCADEVGEGTDEVIDDMIGHLLLMRAKRRHD